MKTYDKEPEYIKIYLDNISRFKDIPPSSNPILIALLKEVSYADKEDGMVLYLNSTLKREIAEECGVSVSRVSHALTGFVKAGFVKRLALGKYLFSPYLFGKGEWEDILEAREVFDRNSIEAEQEE